MIGGAPSKQREQGTRLNRLLVVHPLYTLTVNSPNKLHCILYNTRETFGSASNHRTVLPDWEPMGLKLSPATPSRRCSLPSSPVDNLDHPMGGHGYFSTELVHCRNLYTRPKDGCYRYSVKDVDIGPAGSTYFKFRQWTRMCIQNRPRP